MRYAKENNAVMRYKPSIGVCNAMNAGCKGISGVEQDVRPVVVLL
jgi:hypothetical protein